MSQFLSRGIVHHVGSTVECLIAAGGSERAL
jgi:hypothetical protein